jgi:hypothetical protein
MSCFEMRDLGALKTFVGIQIVRSRIAVHIHLKDYTIQVLDRFGFISGHSVHTLLAPKLIIAPREDECPHNTRKAIEKWSDALCGSRS